MSPEDDEFAGEKPVTIVMRGSGAGTKVSLLVGHKIDIDAGREKSIPAFATWLLGDRRPIRKLPPLRQTTGRANAERFGPMVDSNISQKQIDDQGQGVASHNIYVDARREKSIQRPADTWLLRDRRLGPKTSQLCHRQSKCGAFRSHG
jgi:hypothetical protein